MSFQLDLFEWSDTRPTSVIDAREKFDRRAVDLVFAEDEGMVPRRDGKIIYLLAHRQHRDGRAGGASADKSLPASLEEAAR